MMQFCNVSRLLDTDAGDTNCLITTLRFEQNGRQFADGIYKYNFRSENIWVVDIISLWHVLKGQIEVSKEWFR